MGLAWRFGLGIGCMQVAGCREQLYIGLYREFGRRLRIIV